MTDTIERLRTLIAEQYHVETSHLTTETGLAEAGLDSLAIADLLFSIEDVFKVNLGDIPVEQVPATLGELVGLIDAKSGSFKAA